MTEFFVNPDFLLETAHKLLRILAILVGAAVVLKISHTLIGRFFIPPQGVKTFYLEEKRARTLYALTANILRYIIYFIAVIMLLQECSIDTTSLIAGAGVIGLALGVGAQSLIKDFISGFFIILEDQYSVGDYIVSDNMAGTVEEIGFRSTKLRDANGVLHFIPNGAITRISNYTRGHMQAVVNIPVAYEADLNQVVALLEEACAAVGAAMPEVVSGPKVVGIVEFRSTEMLLRLVAETVPLKQGAVETAIRHKVATLFQSAGIVMPPALLIKS